MERRKRVYPNHKDPGSWLRRALVVLTALVVLGGLFNKEDWNGFLIERQLEKEKPQLEETFDETMTEAEIQLPESRWYALQVGVYESRESAEAACAAFQKRGAAGYLWQNGRFRVLAAAYPSKEDAQLVRQQLQNQHNIDSYIYEITMPAFTLRLRGMRGQLDIFQAAATHADDLARQVQQLSVQMDRQELSVAEAITALQALKEQMEIVVVRIEQRFTKPMDATVSALADCLNHYIAFASTLSAEESAVSMGMKLKYQVFAILSDIQKVCDTLNHL